MSVSMTPEDARTKRLCPNAAIMGDDKTQTVFCHGPICGAWRWSNDEIYRAAIQKKGMADGEKPPFKEATAKVTAKPVTFGLRGHCGLGGQP